MHHALNVLHHLGKRLTFNLIELKNTAALGTSDSTFQQNNLRQKTSDHSIISVGLVNHEVVNDGRRRTDKQTLPTTTQNIP